MTFSTSLVRWPLNPWPWNIISHSSEHALERWRHTVARFDVEDGYLFNVSQWEQCWWEQWQLRRERSFVTERRTMHRVWYDVLCHCCWSIGELPKLCVKIRPDSWLVCDPFRCHREWRHEWQHGGLCPCRRSFGCVLLLDQMFRKQCTVRQYTTLIYLISLLGKLVLGLGLDSELHYFRTFTENKKNEHLIFCECHGH